MCETVEDDHTESLLLLLPSVNGNSISWLLKNIYFFFRWLRCYVEISGIFFSSSKWNRYEYLKKCFSREREIYFFFELFWTICYGYILTSWDGKRYIFIYEVAHCHHFMLRSVLMMICFSNIMPSLAHGMNSTYEMWWTVTAGWCNSFVWICVYMCGKGGR